MGTVASPIRLKESSSIEVTILDSETNIDTPSEWRYTLANYRILVNFEDFFVFKNAQNIKCDCRQLTVN